MHVVILHEGGRIDAEALDALVLRGLALYRAGADAPRYCLLASRATLEEAATTAAELRRERRRGGTTKDTNTHEKKGQGEPQTS